MSSVKLTIPCVWLDVDQYDKCFRDVTSDLRVDNEMLNVAQVGSVFWKKQVQLVLTRQQSHSSLKINVYKVKWRNNGDEETLRFYSCDFSLRGQNVVNIRRRESYNDIPWFDVRTFVAASPLTCVMHSLKFWRKKRGMENEFLKNNKNFHSSGFSDHSIKQYFAKLQWNVFFAFKSRDMRKWKGFVSEKERGVRVHGRRTWAFRTAERSQLCFVESFWNVTSLVCKSACKADSWRRQRDGRDLLHSPAWRFEGNGNQRCLKHLSFLLSSEFWSVLLLSDCFGYGLFSWARPRVQRQHVSLRRPAGGSCSRSRPALHHLPREHTVPSWWSQVSFPLLFECRLFWDQSDSSCFQHDTFLTFTLCHDARRSPALTSSWLSERPIYDLISEQVPVIRKLKQALPVADPSHYQSVEASR